MVEYKESFNKLDVFYNGESIGHIEREAGFNNYFMYYNNNLSAQILDEKIDTAKKKLEVIIKEWEKIFQL